MENNQEPLYKTWSRAQLDNEERGALDEYLEDYETIASYQQASAVEEMESAWLAGFQYAMKRSAEYIGKTLEDAAILFRELGKRD